jgi:hypothetical protein
MAKHRVRLPLQLLNIYKLTSTLYSDDETGVSNLTLFINFGVSTGIAAFQCFTVF